MGLATAMLVLAPIVAVLQVSGILHFVAPGMKLNKLLGLDSRFEAGERVRIRAAALTSIHSEAEGSVRSFRVVRGADFATPQAEEGTILYLDQLEDGECVEVPEQFLREAH